MSIYTEHLKYVQRNSKLINEDDPRLVDKGVPDYVPVMDSEKVHMEDAPGLIDSSFGQFVDVFLANAEVIYRTLEAEDHRSTYTLMGNTIEIIIHRLAHTKKEKDEYTKNYSKNEKVERESRGKGQVEEVGGSK